MTGKVSIIIPCRNEVNYIQRCINSIQQNDYPLKEIIVIDGMSDDGTRKVIERLAKTDQDIIVKDNPERITPIAMNIGVRSATGDYIMIAGAHSSYPANYISTLVEFLEKLPYAVGTGGVMKTETDGSMVSIAIAKVLSDKWGVGNSMFRVGTRQPMEVDTLPFGLYYKQVFDKTGMYHEALRRNQDIEWSRRVTQKAGKLYLIPQVYCTYFLRGNYKYLSRSNYMNGHWNILTVYITKKLSSLSLRHFIPLLFILSLVAPVVISIFTIPWIALLSPLILFAYLLFLMIHSFRIVEKKRNVFRIFFSFPVLHFSYAIGSLTGLFRIDKLLK
jgi:glycosyltransferase involved in cell wall biosynthesis